MKISIQEHNGHKLHIILPSGLVFNPITAHFITKFAEKNGVQITDRQTVLFVKELNHFRKKHKDWKLIEVQSADGDIVEIQL